MYFFYSYAPIFGERSFFVQRLKDVFTPPCFDDVLRNAPIIASYVPDVALNLWGEFNRKEYALEEEEESKERIEKQTVSIHSLLQSIYQAFQDGIPLRSFQFQTPCEYLTLLSQLHTLGFKIKHLLLKRVPSKQGRYTEKDCLQFITLLKKFPEIETLSFAGFGLENISVITEHLHHFQNATSLNLSSNYINLVDAYNLSEALKNLQNLTSLNLSYCNIHRTKEGLDAEGSKIENLTEGLKSLKNLNILNLSGNESGDEEIFHLKVVLEEIPSLTHLYLSSNKLTSLSALYLEEALKKQYRLKLLDLGFNQIEEEGAISLSRALKDLPSLKYLNLGYNRLNHRGIFELLFHLNFKKMKLLDFSNSFIDFDGMIDLERRFSLLSIPVEPEEIVGDEDRPCGIILSRVRRD